MARVLIVDDDMVMNGMLCRMLNDMEHEAYGVPTLHAGLEAIRREAYDVVYLDVRLPDGNGLDALAQFTRAASSPEVIIMTGVGDPDGAELAIKTGAWDYVEKPSPLQNMVLPLMRALQYRDEKRAKDESGVVKALRREGIVGNSPEMMACFDLLARFACTDANVLISGETGTGKELFGVAVHNNSRRALEPFVVVDCSALPETLVESMLFGHERGAFTGADRRTEGLVRQAHGGTLFLDEVGELPLIVQKAFLRVLQERRMRPLGAKAEVPCDFRLVAATNRDLSEMVRGGLFREDLLYRLKSCTIELPPLRERSGDIRELSMYHVSRVCERYGMGLKGYTPEFMSALLAYPWPGNVRELFHAIEHAVAAARTEFTLFVKHLPDEVRIAAVRAALNKKSAAEAPGSEPIAHSAGFPLLKDYRESMDRQYLTDLLSYTEGSISKACHVSGLSRSRLYDLLKKYGITPA